MFKARERKENEKRLIDHQKASHDCLQLIPTRDRDQQSVRVKWKTCLFMDKQAKGEQSCSLAASEGEENTEKPSTPARVRLGAIVCNLLLPSDHRRTDEATWSVASMVFFLFFLTRYPFEFHQGAYFSSVLNVEDEHRTFVRSTSFATNLVRAFDFARLRVYISPFHHCPCERTDFERSKICKPRRCSVDRVW